MVDFPFLSPTVGRRPAHLEIVMFIPVDQARGYARSAPLPCNLWLKAGLIKPYSPQDLRLSAIACVKLVLAS